MRIQGLEITRFGRLRDVCTGSRPLESLVVVVGPNESGKSTLFHFLGSMLYGFYPASRDGNPYTPWGEGDIEGSVRLRTRDGSEMEVHRRLLSSPRGTLLRQGRETTLDNRTIPEVRHVPREIFQQVYALSLSELGSLGDREGGWAPLEDRLVAGMGARDLRLPREVAEDLETEAGGLWRENRRGKQEIRELGDEIRELRERAKAAEAADREIRETVDRLEEVRDELRTAEVERERIREDLERAELLGPLSRRLALIERREEAAGDPRDLDGIPEDPRAALERLDRELKEAEERLVDLRRRAEEGREDVSGYTPTMKALLEREAEARTLVSRTSDTGPLFTENGRLEEEIRDRERRIGARTRDLFSTSPDALDQDAVGRVNPRSLRNDLRHWSELRRRRQVRKELLAERAREVGYAPPGFRPGPWLLAAAGGSGLLAAVLGVWAASSGSALGWALCGAGLLLATVFALLWWGFSRSAAREDAGGSERGEGDDGSGAAGASEEEEARSAVLDRLEGLPVREERLRRPEEEIATEIERLQESLAELEDRRLRRADVEDELDGLRDRLDRLSSDTGLALPEDLSAAGHVLGRALDEARERREAARIGARELERLEADESAAVEVAHTLARERADLVEPLTALGDGSKEAGIAEVERRREAREAARSLRLEAEREHPDLEELAARIAAGEASGEPWLTDPDWLPERRAARTRITERIEELGREEERLESRVEHAREQETVDRIDAEIAELQERKARLADERDRKWLVARIIREADRRFRDAHQPDVIRRAGRYLQTVTDGRYDRVVLSDDPDSPPFRLREAATDRRVDVAPPLSTGTRDQVYLALRLAAVDHLDAGGEPLPLFVDEVFVNWDSYRTERGFDLLETITEKRQLFVFTCHEAVADALERRGARVLRLGEKE